MLDIDIWNARFAKYELSRLVDIARAHGVSVRRAALSPDTTDDEGWWEIDRPRLNIPVATAATNAELRQVLLATLSWIVTFPLESELSPYAEWQLAAQAKVRLVQNTVDTMLAALVLAVVWLALRSSSWVFSMVWIGAALLLALVLSRAASLMLAGTIERTKNRDFVE